MSELFTEFSSQMRAKYESEVDKGKHPKPWSNLSEEELINCLEEEIKEYRETDAADEKRREAVDIGCFAAYLWLSPILGHNKEDD